MGEVYKAKDTRLDRTVAMKVQRFLTVAPLGRESMTPTTVVLDWAAGLAPK